MGARDTSLLRSHTFGVFFSTGVDPVTCTCLSTRPDKSWGTNESQGRWAREISHRWIGGSGNKQSGHLESAHAVSDDQRAGRRAVDRERTGRATGASKRPRAECDEGVGMCVRKGGGVCVLEHVREVCVDLEKGWTREEMRQVAGKRRGRSGESHAQPWATMGAEAPS